MLNMQIVEIITAVFLSLISIATAVFITYLRRRGWLDTIETEIAAKQELAALAVRFAEQFYRDLNGPEKYRRAAIWLEEQLAENGIRFSADEIRGLVEAALRQIKDQFGDEWSEETKNKQVKGFGQCQ